MVRCPRRLLACEPQSHLILVRARALLGKPAKAGQWSLDAGLCGS